MPCAGPGRGAVRGEGHGASVRLDRVARLVVVEEHEAEAQPGGGEVGCRCRRPAQPGLGVPRLLLLPPIRDREIAHGVDVVRVVAKEPAQHLDGLVRATGTEVVGALGHAASRRIAIEIGLEVAVRLRTPTNGGECLAELSMRGRRSRIETDGLLEQGDRVLVAALLRADAAEILVEQGNVRCQRHRLLDLPRRLDQAALLRQRATEQGEVLHAARIHQQVVPADLLGTQGTVGLHGRDRVPDAVRVQRHQRSAVDRATSGAASCAGGR